MGSTLPFGRKSCNELWMREPRCAKYKRYNHTNYKGFKTSYACKHCIAELMSFEVSAWKK